MNFYKFLFLTGGSLLLPLTGYSAPADVSAADTISAAMVTAPPATDKPSVWTFDDCIDWASANSSDIRKALLNILTARQDVLSAKDAWLPTVGFSTNQSFTNYPSPEAGRKSNAYGSSYSDRGNPRNNHRSLRHLDDQDFRQLARADRSLLCGTLFCRMHCHRGDFRILSRGKSLQSRPD